MEPEKVVHQSFDELLLSADPQAFQAFLSHALEYDDRNTLIAAEMATHLFEMVADLKDRMRQEDEDLDDDSINHQLIHDYVSRDQVHVDHPDADARGEVNAFITPKKAVEGFLCGLP